MSYSADEIRQHLEDAIIEARTMYDEAVAELDEVESTISEMECSI